MAYKKYARKCTACDAGMNEGYCIESGMEYYCSDACLYLNMTPAEYLELHADGEGDSYWTDWSEDPDEYMVDEDEDEDEDEVDTYHARDCSVPDLTAEVERLREALKKIHHEVTNDIAGLPRDEALNIITWVAETADAALRQEV